MSDALSAIASADSSSAGSYAALDGQTGDTQVARLTPRRTRGVAGQLTPSVAAGCVGRSISGLLSTAAKAPNDA